MQNMIMRNKISRSRDKREKQKLCLKKINTNFILNKQKKFIHTYIYNIYIYICISHHIFITRVDSVYYHTLKI